MEYHREQLKSLCRLCRNEEVIPRDRLPIKKEAHSVSIERSLKIDVTGDDPDVFPPFVCMPCHYKLKRWKAKKNRYKLGGNLNITPAIFEEHTDNCCVCKGPEEVGDSTAFPTSSVVGIAAREAVTYGLNTTTENTSICCWKTCPENKTVTMRLYIHQNGAWTIDICGKPGKMSPLLSKIPEYLDVESCRTLFKLIDSSTMCIGCNGFDDLCRSKSKHQLALFFNTTGGIEAYEQDLNSYRTVRNVKCEILLLPNKTSRCSVCVGYRDTLHAYVSKAKNKASNENKDPTITRARNDRLSREQLENKTRQLQKDKRQLKRKFDHLQDQIQHIIEENGDVLDENLSKSFSSIMEEKNDEILSSFPADSPQLIFWQQQREASTKSKTQRRWHPLVVRWCIALHSKSPSAYRFLRNTGTLILPCESTLRDYTQFTEATDGINPDIIQRIKDDIKFDSEPEYKRNVSLVFDEIKIKSGLVYRKETGRLIGFCNLGSVNDDIQNYVEKLKHEHETGQETDSSPLATHILALMVRGIFSPLREVFAWFPCCGFSSQQLYWTIWEGVEILELSSFIVRALVADGATPNRKFFTLQGNDDEDLTYYCINPYDKSRKIYFISDVPHLMKTTRNNWENSGWNNKTRNLHYDGQPITWKQLVNLVEEDVGFDGIAVLRKLPKITHEHLHLTPSLRMRVKIAAQVLSSSVSTAFELQGRHDTGSVKLFTFMMDRFFDCLNVSSVMQGQRSRKLALYPYHSADDWRFEWLEKDFLGYLDKWEADCLATPNLSITERKKMCLSRETLLGLRMTVKSFVELGKELLAIDGVDYLLSEKLSQDPLEEYFSKQRGCVGRNDNPTLAEFSRNVLSLHVAGASTVQASARGNCNNRNREDDAPENIPLPRRQKNRATF